jgi:peptidoglycan/LPS O-acetylase OafA/YrhL
MRNLEIERLRAAAISLVLLQHLPRLREALPPMLREGTAGVQLFFVISGYVVAGSLLKTLPSGGLALPLLERFRVARPALAAFMIRRVHRIAPMALLWALIPMALEALRGGAEAGAHLKEMLAEFFAIVTLQYNYAAAYGLGRHLGYYWSLAVEEHFYLLLPLMMVACASAERRILAMLAGIALVVCVLRPFIPFDGPADWAWAWNFASHRNFDFLFAGVLIYLLREQGFLKAVGTLSRPWALLIAQSSLVAIWLTQGVLPQDYFVRMGQLALLGLAVIVVLLAGFEQEWVLPIPGLRRAFEWLGARSYGLYLIHPNVFHIDGVLASHPTWPSSLKRIWFSPWGQTITVLLIGCAVAEVCYRLIEKPLIARGHRIATRWLSAPTPAPTSASTPASTPMPNAEVAEARSDFRRT